MVAPAKDPSAKTPALSARAAEAKLIAFLSELRGSGFRIGLGESRDALTIALGAPAADRARFQSSLRHLLCSSREEWVTFDAYFRAHYGQQQDSEAGEPTDSAEGDTAGDKPTPKFQIVADFYHGADAGKEGGAGRNAAVTKTDFRFLTDSDDWEEAARLTEDLARRIQSRPTRRWRQKAGGKRIDLAATARRLPGSDGDPLWLGYRARRKRPMHVVALLDVSHSMSYYSPMLARFVRGLVHNFKDCEAFCFHMELNRVTDHLKETDLDVMREKMEALENLWYGGTNIGQSIEAFNKRFLKETVRPNSVVLLFTDGCDTSPPEELRKPLRELRANVRRVFWINPLRERLLKSGLTSSSPLAAASGAIDAQLSGDSFRSLAALARVLSSQG
ncbi:MAG: VWA domain-containing protein [Rhodomicrobium sp.]|nr:MAG: VWA domain-containing protein [Rhodomicrobium sp.]